MAGVHLEIAVSVGEGGIRELTGLVMPASLRHIMRRENEALGARHNELGKLTVHGALVVTKAVLDIADLGGTG